MVAVLVPLLGFALAPYLFPMGPVATGTVLLQGQPLDRGGVQEITNVGDCPGKEQSELRDLSFLAALPPAPFQRITLQHLATGNYNNGGHNEQRRSSEAFAIVLSHGQRDS